MPMPMPMHYHQVHRRGNFLDLTTTSHPPIYRIRSFTAPHQRVGLWRHKHHPQARRAPTRLRRSQTHPGHFTHGRTQFAPQPHLLTLPARLQRPSPVTSPLLRRSIGAPVSASTHSECLRLHRRALPPLVLQAAPIAWRQPVFKAKYRMNRSKQA
jgi:hypothetical protein